MNKPPSILVIFIGLLILGLGLLLSVFQGILHAPEYISAYLTKVDHPIKAHYDYTDKFLKEVVKDGKVDYAAARNNKNLDKALKEFAELSCDEFENDGERLIYLEQRLQLDGDQNSRRPFSDRPDKKMSIMIYHRIATLLADSHLRLKISVF